MEFRTIVETLASRTELDAKTIVLVAQTLSTFDLTTAEGILSFARTLPEWDQLHREGRRIYGIKFIREAVRQRRGTDPGISLSKRASDLYLDEHPEYRRTGY